MVLHHVFSFSLCSIIFIMSWFVCLFLLPFEKQILFKKKEKYKVSVKSFWKFIYLDLKAQTIFFKECFIWWPSWPSPSSYQHLISLCSARYFIINTKFIFVIISGEFSVSTNYMMNHILYINISVWAGCQNHLDKVGEVSLRQSWTCWDSNKVVLEEAE